MIDSVKPIFECRNCFKRAARFWNKVLHLYVHRSIWKLLLFEWRLICKAEFGRLLDLFRVAWFGNLSRLNDARFVMSNFDSINAPYKFGYVSLRSNQAVTCQKSPKFHTNLSNSEMAFPCKSIQIKVSVFSQGRTSNTCLPWDPSSRACLQATFLDICFTWGVWKVSQVYTDCFYQVS